MNADPAAQTVHTPSSVLRRITDIPLILLGLMTLLLAVVVVLSFRWPMVHDAPIVYYIAFLIDRFGFVPYRDIFDMNAPGTYGIYILLERLFGFGDLGFRAADIVVLACTFFFTWNFVKTFDRRAAWAGCVLFGLLYLRAGSRDSLQRECFVVLFFSASLFLTTALPRLKPVVRNGLIGCLAGFSVLVKPQSIVAYGLLIAYEFVRSEPQNRASLARRMLVSFVPGFLLPIAGVSGYLLTSGGMKPFLEIATEYWPLYTDLNGAHQILVGAWAKFFYAWTGLTGMGGYSRWAIPALFGIFACLFYSAADRTARLFLSLIAGILVVFLLYPVLSGQFWRYHWYPFVYALSIAGGLGFSSLVRLPHIVRQLAPPVLILFATSGNLPVAPEIEGQLRGIDPGPALGGRVAEIAGYLETHLRPGDTVQPLDWTGGAVHAMLKAKARIATRFIYDFHFYHHISEPYIQNLRAQFIGELQSSRPRFIVEITENKPWVSGYNTTRSFEALAQILTTEYRVTAAGRGYYIYERMK